MKENRVEQGVNVAVEAAVAGLLSFEAASARVLSCLQQRRGAIDTSTT